MGRVEGWGGGRQHWSSSLGLTPWGGPMLALPVRGQRCCTGRPFAYASYKGTCVVARYTGCSPHRVQYTVGHWRSPCGAGAALASPDGRCALPAAPHWARTALRAVGSALCQAHWAPLRAGATLGYWLTVPRLSRLIVAAQTGPIRSPVGAPNPSRQVPCQRHPAHHGCLPLLFRPCPRGSRCPRPPPPRFSLPGRSPACSLLHLPHLLRVCPVSAHWHGGLGVGAGSCVASCATTCSSLRRFAPATWCRCSAWCGFRLWSGPWGGGRLVLVVWLRSATLAVGVAGEGLCHVFYPPVRSCFLPTYSHGSTNEHCRHG